MLLVYIPFALINAPQPARRVKDHLKRKEIWMAMKELLGHVIAYIQGQSPTRKGRAHTKTIAEIETLIRALEVLFLDISDVIIPLVEEVLQLIDLAALIRRPLHGQSVALIYALLRLEQYSREEEHKNISTFRAELKELMLESITVLQNAKDAVADVKTFTWESREIAAQRHKLDELFTKVRQCFSYFQIDDQFDSWHREFIVGAKTDEGHLKDMRARLNR